MAGKETVRAKLDRLRGRSSRGETVSVDASALLRFADGGIHFLLAAVLAGAAVFGEYAPFGVALVGAAGSGVCGAAALLGACFGYLIPPGLRRAGCGTSPHAILTFAVNFAFYDVKAAPQALGHAPGGRGCSTASPALSTCPRPGWRTEDVIYFVTELSAARGVGWLLPAAPSPPAHAGGGDPLPPADGQPVGSGLHHAARPVPGLTLLGDISLGRLPGGGGGAGRRLAGGHAPPGPVLGVAAGLALDLAANGVPLYAMAYGLSGLMAGSSTGRSRLRAALAYVLANGVSGALDLGQGAAHLHPVRGVLGLGGLSPPARARLCGGWGPGGPGQPGPARRTAGPRPRIRAPAGGRPPRPSAPCTRPCGLLPPAPQRQRRGHRL